MQSSVHIHIVVLLLLAKYHSIYSLLVVKNIWILRECINALAICCFSTGMEEENRIFCQNYENLKKKNKRRQCCGEQSCEFYDNLSPFYLEIYFLWQQPPSTVCRQRIALHCISTEFFLLWRMFSLFSLSSTFLYFSYFFYCFPFFSFFSFFSYF